MRVVVILVGIALVCAALGGVLGVIAILSPERKEDEELEARFKEASKAPFRTMVLGDSMKVSYVGPSRAFSNAPGTWVLLDNVDLSGDEMAVVKRAKSREEAARLIDTFKAAREAEKGSEPTTPGGLLPEDKKWLEGQLRQPWEHGQPPGMF